ncbi:aldehyde dehydrogenase family protein [Mesorhizobium sp. RP14(2022)]|uniref:Aldehyde dehydrogenase family protein n=1 Tax=Mesorhizobium liriopis TaxID=2953882 RepID=A0ABT1CDI0_9HYPH|nr:aldehyde dehydrogenase family protein [Mesorhizobium liriopis]MCO6052246.1 aldehyde dehydrogenase family protein [Mesorhizobium liriopis]
MTTSGHALVGVTGPLPNAHFISGHWCPASDGTRFETIDPSTEAVLGEVARGSDADIDAAVEAAHHAFHGAWRAISPADRGKLLLRVADLLEADIERFATMETLDVGKPLKESRSDVRGACATLRYNAGAADKMEGATIPLGRDLVDFTMLEPVGVTAHIVPWNYPLGMVARSVAPALAAGCTVVVKPAEQSPLTALAFAELCHRAGLPDGVVNVVTGYGPEAGAALVRHPLVRGITFTGSVETGRKIYAGAAAGLKPVVLELGGKNPMIVFEDADLDRAAFDALDGAFGNSGQVCSSSSRFLLHCSISDAFLDKLAAGASRLTVGKGLDDPDLGPLVSAEQYDKVSDYLEAGHASGSRLVVGGGRPEGLARGYFVAPTIFADVDAVHPLAREEIFGPVAVSSTFDTANEALSLTNSLGYGLVAGVYTRDVSRALSMARDIDAGSVWINGWFIGGVQAPTGGIKDSGIGRERGLPGVRNYLSMKNIGIRL